LVEEQVVPSKARLRHAEPSKDADRALIGFQRLGPDVAETEVVEGVVQSCRGGQVPDSQSPPSALANHEAELASVRLISVKVDVAHQVAVEDRPQPDQVLRRRKDKTSLGLLTLSK
jgi:hypothetical protein